MDFFMSAERDADIREGESYARKKIAPVLIKLLNDIELKSGLKSWSFISIILSDKFLTGMPEIFRLNKKDMDLDCRLHINHGRFKEGNEREKIEMILDAIERSIEMMSIHKITQNDQKTLKDVLNKAREKLLNTNQ